ncbi:unnamed protein product [Rotaria sp. Silwood1]|nr:unnamed protein product [Rotaria sp. Silwood1]
MEQLYMLIHEETKEKQAGSHRVAAEIVAGVICGSKYWTLEMENKDPRRIYRLIHFIRTLINTKTMLNTFNEISRWTLITNLNEFQWRIPSIWCEINDYAKEFLDHPYKNVRESIASILSISISFDITLFNGKSTRHPNTSQFIDTICKRLRQAIEVYERTSLSVLGLCAIVLSSPYDIPSYVPDALMLLCEHSHDPDIIQKSIKNCLSEFRRTHHDSWHEHREQFTEDQLAVLADVLISHSYYA